jgi:hypothetical protein
MRLRACGGRQLSVGRGATDIDVAGLATPPAMRAIAESPRIRVFERFATAAERNWLIECGRRSLRRALVYRRDAEGHQATDSRTNTEAEFTFGNASVLLALVRDRISAATGQQFALHGDFQETNTPALAAEVNRRGQHIATFLIYLNDEYEGGETVFPNVGLRHRGMRGDALLFFNVDAAGRPDYNSVHAGQPTVRGEKWVFSQWIRGRPVG